MTTILPLVLNDGDLRVLSVAFADRKNHLDTLIHAFEMSDHTAADDVVLEDARHQREILEGLHQQICDHMYFAVTEQRASRIAEMKSRVVRHDTES